MTKITQSNKVYVNLNAECLSVQARNGKSWKVINHTNSCLITDFATRVGQATRLRIIAENKKYVHAFILGEVSYDVPGDEAEVVGTVSYNPYKVGYFTVKIDGEIGNFDEWIAANGTDGYALRATYGDFPKVEIIKL